jgi:hypothetical protein
VAKPFFGPTPPLVERKKYERCGEEGRPKAKKIEEFGLTGRDDSRFALEVNPCCRTQRKKKREANKIKSR